MRTAYVVLTYNRSDALLAVLRGLAPQCGPDDMVVVADDGSRPEHVQALREGLPQFACRVRHVWHPDTGFTAARARNLGAGTAAQAGAQYIVFMDGDCVPTPHFAAAHRALRGDGFFVNGSRVLLGRAFTERVLRREIELAELSPTQWIRRRLAGDVNKLSHLVCWAGAPGRVQRAFSWRGIRSCNFGVWWHDLQAVNGFDETFSGWGHEDADLVLRLHRHGLRRRNGFLATEVFHLWHPEHSRAGEAANRQRVQDRMQARQVRASAGLGELGHADTTVIDLHK